MRFSPPTTTQVLSTQGVVNKIQSLNRLQTVVYHVDSVIQSHKQGNWYRLWQDEQKGLFIVHGRVQAGIDLSQLNAEHVEISADGQQVKIKLPPAQIFETYLDKIEVYDVKTGLFNILDIDPQVFNQAQDEAKKQVLVSACKSDILQLANDNAQSQVQALFKLADVDVIVDKSPVSSCTK
ncbi:DUF4230 domain-containing protein [Moraxella sp. ZY21109]